MTIWENIKTEFLQKIVRDFNVNDLVIMGGYFKEGPESYVVNLILSMCRWGIWKRRNVIKYERTNETIYECVKNVTSEIRNHCKILQKEKHEKAILDLI
jgi:hypothetical protein